MKHRAEIEAEDGYLLPRWVWIGAGAAVLIVVFATSHIWPMGVAS